jgi:hypothetical protein
MIKSLAIEHIEVSPKVFVEEWSNLYTYTQEELYDNHIQMPFASFSSFEALFRWKNGIKGPISKPKLKLVHELWGKHQEIQQLDSMNPLEFFEDAMEPAKNATIWKIFLLHLYSPNHFPIFDQHVYRAYIYAMYGYVDNLTLYDAKQKWEKYKNNYYHWFITFREAAGKTVKETDQALFQYGKTLAELEKLKLIGFREGHIY